MKLSADVFHLYALHTSSTISVTAHTAARTTVKSVKGIYYELREKERERERERECVSVYVCRIT